PGGPALGREGLDGVEVGLEGEPLPCPAGKGWREPLRERLGRALHERDHGLTIEGAVRLGVVRVRVVPGKAEQQRRYAEGERDLAGGGVLRLDEIHVLGAERERLPVEPALEQQRPAGIRRALVAELEL